MKRKRWSKDPPLHRNALSRPPVALRNTCCRYIVKLLRCFWDELRTAVRLFCFRPALRAQLPLRILSAGSPSAPRGQPILNSHREIAPGLPGKNRLLVAPLLRMTDEEMAPSLPAQTDGKGNGCRPFAPRNHNEG